MVAPAGTSFFDPVGTPNTVADRLFRLGGNRQNVRLIKSPKKGFPRKKHLYQPSGCLHARQESQQTESVLPIHFLHVGQLHTGFLFLISTMAITESQALSSKYGFISAKLQAPSRIAEVTFSGTTSTMRSESFVPFSAASKLQLPTSHPSMTFARSTGAFLVKGTERVHLCFLEIPITVCPLPFGLPLCLRVAGDLMCPRRS